MSIGLIGTKIGMTREFMESGQSVPVTVIKGIKLFLSIKFLKSKVSRKAIVVNLTSLNKTTKKKMIIPK